MKRVNSRQADWVSGVAPKHDPTPISITEVVRKPTILKAIEYGIECAGLTEKQVYDPLGWKAEVWSRIFSNDPDIKNPAFFDVRRLIPLMEITGNDAPLVWLCHHRHKDWSTIRDYRSDLERENEALRTELAELKRERETIVRFVQETRK